MTSNALTTGDDRARDPISRRLITALLRVSPDLIAVIDANGTLTYASPAS